MAQFESKNNKSLKINGYDVCSIFGLSSIHIKSRVERTVGISRKIVYENGVFLNKEDVPPQSILIELARVDFYGHALPFNDKELDELLRIMYKEEICTLECDGLLYYGTFTQGDLTLFKSNKGYMSIPYEMCTPYAYTCITNGIYRVVGEREIEIFNSSNVARELFVDIEIEQLNSGNVSIENKMIKNNYMIFKNANKGDTIKVYGEGQKEIECSSGINMFDNTEYGEFIKLKYGKNIIKIKGNDVKVKIIHQEPKIIK